MVGWSGEWQFQAGPGLACQLQQPERMNHMYTHRSSTLSRDAEGGVEDVDPGLVSCEAGAVSYIKHPLLPEHQSHVCGYT